MLSLFPGILFLAPLSAFLIRIALAFILGYSAWNHFSRSENALRVFGVLEIAINAAIATGTWTQAAALAALVVAGIYVVVPKVREVALGTSILSVVLCLSLLVTGAGIFAFDLPL